MNPLSTNQTDHIYDATYLESRADGDVLLLLASLGHVVSTQPPGLICLLRIACGAFFPHDAVCVLVGYQDNYLIRDFGEVADMDVFKNGRDKYSRC